MDIRWIQDFLAVAETGNFTRAAYDRHSSQAAFSRRIQSLEAWLGVTLIDRSAFPTRLTAEGERFRDQAGDILRNLLDVRSDLSDQTGKGDQIRIAVPHALATGRLPRWWAEWSMDRALTCEALPGNVHDTVTSLISGRADMLIGFHHAQQPIHLDKEAYERVHLGIERLSPYAAPSVAERYFNDGLPTSVPLLSYSQGTYLGRMVEIVRDTTEVPIAGTTVFSSDMADILREVAITGAGVAWLPDCIVAHVSDRLVQVGGEESTINLSVVAYRDRSRNSKALDRLWSVISQKVNSPSR